MSLAYSILVTGCVAEAKSRWVSCSRSNPMLSSHIILSGADNYQAVTSVWLMVDGQIYVTSATGHPVCHLYSGNTGRGCTST